MNTQPLPGPYEINEHLLSLGNSEIAAHSSCFFKTAIGEYGEGDKFLGIRVPVVRQAVKQFRVASLDTASELLQSEFHEIRLFALLLLVHRYTACPQEQDTIYRLYLENTKYINNWDLVDSSAHHIVGAYLYQRKRQVLDKLAVSSSLWERRIAIIATFYFIRNEQYYDTLRIAEVLLNDDEDLIHKATGWMLREVGKRDIKAETAFLNLHYKSMPRTMLRYAIEKLEEPLRQRYLKGKI